MKGLKKIALVTAIAAAPFAQAELVSMDDTAMGNTTGQAGITIDINAADISIGEIQYKDAGSIFINNFKLGGAGLVEAAGILAAGGTPDPTPGTGNMKHGTSINNLKINIDVGGSDDTANAAILHGLDKVGKGVVNSDAVVASASYTRATGVGIQTETLTGQDALDAASADFDGDVVIGDGDLVIGLDAQDQNTLVDIGIIIGGVVLGEEGVETGNGTALQFGGGNTVLLANTALAGAIGPVDIVIDGQNGGMNINAYFGLKGSIEMPFVATKFGFALHNTRGLNRLTADVTSDNGAAYELSGAHFNGTIEAAENTADGIHIVVNDFSGDMDITNLTFGSAPAIGDVYFTDMVITADMNIYGH